MTRYVPFLAAAGMIFFVASVLAQQKRPLRYLQSIPLPDLKAGDFDHFAIDRGKPSFPDGGSEQCR
jgi:hypothetical protein